jgi:hypothetical protein
MNKSKKKKKDINNSLKEIQERAGSGGAHL